MDGEAGWWSWGARRWGGDGSVGGRVNGSAEEDKKGAEAGREGSGLFLREGAPSNAGGNGRGEDLVTLVGK